ALTQLSVGQVNAAELAPMREFSTDSDSFRLWAEVAAEKFDSERFARNLRDRTEFAVEGESFSGWEFQMPLIDPLDADVFDYLGDSLIVVDEPGLIEQDLESFFDHNEHSHAENEENGEVGLEPKFHFLDEKEIRVRLEDFARIELRGLGRLAAKTDENFATDGKESPLFLFPTAAASNEIEIQSRASRKFRGKLKELAEVLKSGVEQSPNPHFVFQAEGLAERFSDILRDYDYVLNPELVSIGRLTGGFEIPSLGLEVFTEVDVFGEDRMTDFGSQTISRKSRRRRTSAFISDFRDLKPGDYVVHVDHGIGRFEGLETIGTQGVEREFVLIVYAEKTKLFVPVERLDLVSRFASGENANPTLDRLGGIGWQKTKARAKREMRDMADELLRLYAERKLVQGFAFSRDAPWQKEFEDTFPHQLTVDQSTSIEEIKADMETPTPMDRLIVGDVGYGKTEVAMRAAFKAVMDGRQVAVLTPTTVLSYQHFETFKKRFAAFPVKIELLSRFRNRKEQKDVVAANEKGDVDILIGTHRILSNDVVFQKLGLVVVDEEQRFGVAHKEKLKKLKKKVDVMTLSATPIPRTLNMAMTGLRDMSIIETPPRDRLAINTQVVQFSEGVIKSAIELEMSRTGQVFFIHNRVQTIDAIAAHIQRIVPNARIVIGHGQMGEKDLEKVMLDFVDYKFDVLVATTIIENGIDIPRANTMIINRADNYGLSQLYQLRGRVGRSNRRAYAYLLIPSEMELT
ncbi:MAG: helicase-related protein, partial [Acidobacteriota bacterium]|nr:helicase-related protein [Acidobacteriota bacterium]